MQDMPVLFPKGVGGSYDALGEPTAAIALGTEAGFPPEDEIFDLALGMIVGGLDAWARTKIGVIGGRSTV